MFGQLSDEELINRKTFLNDQIDSLRKKVMIDLNSLEDLCNEGLSLEEEINKRLNVSDTK